MGEVVILDGPTTLDIPPERVLDSAQGKLKTALLMGWDHDGNFYFASSTGNLGNLFYLIECARKRLLREL